MPDAIAIGRTRALQGSELRRHMGPMFFGRAPGYEKGTCSAIPVALPLTPGS